MNQKVIICKGLPGSGKSTFAKELVNDNHGKMIAVSKDDLRQLLHFGEHSKGREKFVCDIRDAIINEALNQGLSVIVHDTNLNPLHINTITEKFKERADIEIEDFTSIPIDECIRRDVKREPAKQVGKKVILEMYNKYLRKDPPKIEYDPTLRDCIIVDVDGTLAIKSDRSPYDWSRVKEDGVNERVRDIVNMAHAFNLDTRVIILSGRDSVCRELTEDWLIDNAIYYDYLFMRPEGNNEKDSIIKERIYNEYIKDKYNVLMWIDDRPQVCRMVYNLGLPLFKVGDPDAEF